VRKSELVTHFLSRVAGWTALLLAALPAHAGFHHWFVSGDGSNSKLALRKRLHVNTLITEPGTFELEWSSLYAFDSANFRMPATLKYTPAGHSIIWGRTEYSLAFDSLTSAESGGGRVTQFSQSLTLTATSVLHDGEKFDFAIAPQAVFFLHGETGARLGAIAIARYDVGRNSIGGTFSWSGATNSSDTNPFGTIDAGFGFGRRLAASGILGKFTPHVNAVWERSTGMDRVVSVFEGVEYQANERLAFDLSAQHFDIHGNAPDRQLVIGMTLNLGKVD
jgi:hypothetical protein